MSVVANSGFFFNFSSYVWQQSSSSHAASSLSSKFCVDPGRSSSAKLKSPLFLYRRNSQLSMSKFEITWEHVCHEYVISYVYNYNI